MGKEIDKTHLQHWERYANMNIMLHKGFSHGDPHLYRSLKAIVEFYKNCQTDNINKEIHIKTYEKDIHT